jgi:hypothetical protein
MQSCVVWNRPGPHHAKPSGVSLLYRVGRQQANRLVHAYRVDGVPVFGGLVVDNPDERLPTLFAN